MNTVHKSAAVFGLAALALGICATVPASARDYHHPFLRHAQRRHAVRLDRKAAHAAFNGHYRRASRLRHRAWHLRAAARHGH